MILDLQRFVTEGRPFWDELEGMLKKLENDPAASLSLEAAKRFYYLYQRASADLARVATFAAEPEIRTMLEGLVGRAYGEIHRQRKSSSRWSPWSWFSKSFPRAFRRRSRAFLVSSTAMLVGCSFGGLAVQFDPDAKEVVLPFQHLLGDPSERVASEEKMDARQMDGQHATFSSELMTHNTQVAITTLAFGMTLGFGTLVLLFYNGVILGAVVVDYVAAGESTFLLGWLLPHGSIEIPAILIAGQGGLVLGSALIGWQSRVPLQTRLRLVGPDLATLIGGVAVMLVWAGLVESFFSQYHEPVIPYFAKIGFGFLELGLLISFLTFSGRKPAQSQTPANHDQLQC